VQYICASLCILHGDLDSHGREATSIKFAASEPTVRALESRVEYMWVRQLGVQNRQGYSVFSEAAISAHHQSAAQELQLLFKKSAKLCASFFSREEGTEVPCSSLTSSRRLRRLASLLRQSSHARPCESSLQAPLAIGSPPCPPLSGELALPRPQQQ